MSVSIGLLMLQQEDEHSETVLHRADQVLYQAKLGGRDRLLVDDPAALQAQPPGALQRRGDATAADLGSPATQPGSPTSG